MSAEPGRAQSAGEKFACQVCPVHGSRNSMQTTCLGGWVGENSLKSHRTFNRPGLKPLRTF